MPLSLNKARAEDLSVIEAFRLGIVPYDAIESWTQGRSGELERIKEWLNDFSQGTLLMEGTYGSGKTHFLHFLYANAIRSGYAVSLVDLDASEATAAFPKRIYRQILRNLKAPVGNEWVGFRGLMHAIAETVETNPVDDHPFLGPFIDELRRSEVRETLWAWIEGREAVKGKYGTLYDFTTVANIYCHILSGLGWLLVKVFDLNGFLILFDEVETARSVAYRYHFVRGLNFFRGLSLVANDDPVLLEEKIVRNGNGTRRGVETGLVYSGHVPIPYLYRIPSYLKVVFGITPAVLTREFREWRKSVPLIELNSLGIEDLAKLFDAFVVLFQRVYGVRMDPLLKRRSFTVLFHRYGFTSTRMFIKSMVEFMDFLRFYPGRNIEALLGE